MRVCRECDRTVTTDAVRAVVEESDRESVINALNRIRLESPSDQAGAEETREEPAPPAGRAALGRRVVRGRR